MKSDPRADTLDAPAVAEMHARPAKGSVGWLVQLALLVLVPLAILLAATVAALLIVRIGGDLRLGLNPFDGESGRVRLNLYELAARGVSNDVLRQVLIAVLVLVVAWRSDGAAWRRRLGLTRPAAPRKPIPQVWRLWLFFLVWPAIHITWVAASAEALNVSFGQNVRLSPFLTSALLAASFAYVALLAPIAEELLLRGEAYARAAPIMGQAGAIVATALLFCALHVGFSLGPDMQLRFDKTWYARPITLLPLAITLGWLRWRTGRLWPCILLHGWSNGALIAYQLWPSIR